MKLNTKLAASTAILLALAACGGSSSSDSTQVSRIITGPNALNIGTTSTTDSANGLPFAGEDFDFDNPGAATVRLVRFISDNETGETFIQVSDEVVNLESFDGDSEDGYNGTITFNGEQVEISDGTGELADGSILNLFELIEGNWSSIISAYSYVYGGEELEPGFNTEGSFAAGLQTNPNNMPVTIGTTRYVGDFSGYSTILDGDGNVIANEVSIDGQTVINAQFSDSTIGGTLTFETDGDEGDDLPFNVFATLELDEADIVGNGFSTTANTVIGCASFACSSDTQIGGAFFGPSADELSGVAGINYSEVDESGDGIQVIGAGGFIAEVEMLNP